MNCTHPLIFTYKPTFGVLTGNICIHIANAYKPTSEIQQLQQQFTALSEQVAALSIQHCKTGWRVTETMLQCFCATEWATSSMLAPYSMQTVTFVNALIE